MINHYRVSPNAIWWRVPFHLADSKAPSGVLLYFRDMVDRASITVNGYSNDPDYIWIPLSFICHDPLEACKYINGAVENFHPQIHYCFRSRFTRIKTDQVPEIGMLYVDGDALRFSDEGEYYNWMNLCGNKVLQYIHSGGYLHDSRFAYRYDSTLLNTSSDKVVANSKKADIDAPEKLNEEFFKVRTIKLNQDD